MHGAVTGGDVVAGDDVVGRRAGRGRSRGSASGRGTPASRGRAPARSRTRGRARRLGSSCRRCRSRSSDAPRWRPKPPADRRRWRQPPDPRCRPRSSASRQDRPSALISWWRSSWSRLKLSSTSSSGRPWRISSRTTRSSVSRIAMSACGCSPSAEAMPWNRFAPSALVTTRVALGQPRRDGGGQQMRGRRLTVGARHRRDPPVAQQLAERPRVDAQHHLAPDAGPAAASGEPGGRRREASGADRQARAAPSRRGRPDGRCSGSLTPWGNCGR